MKKKGAFSKEADNAFADNANLQPKDYVFGRRSKTYPTEIGGTSFNMESGVAQKNDSLQVMRHHAQEQIKKLQEQADLLVRQGREIENRVGLAEKIGKARFNFKPVMLKPYYLYQMSSEDQVLTLTLIAPEEWNGPSPFGKLVAKVRQLGDSTWETLDSIS